MKITIIFLAVCLSTLAFAQDVKVKVLDAETSKGAPVPYANICVESMDNKIKEYFITDVNGIVSFPLTQQRIISISCMGFKALIDTLSPGIKEKTYILEPSLYEINSVVVTGQYKPVSADKSIYDIKLIGKDRIESKAANNLADVLSDELGIRLSNDPSTGTSMSLQGVTGENIKILVDGVPVIGRLDGNIDLSQLNLDNVSQVEMVEGPMSVIYGSNALGGVINIITENSSHSQYKTSVNSYYESVGTYNFNFLTSIRQKKNTFEVNGGRNFFSGYSLEDTRSKEWKPKEQYNAGISYYHNTEKTKLRLKSDFFNERLLDRNEPFAPYYEKANDTWYKTFRFNNSAEITNKIGENSGFNMLAAYSIYERQKEKYLVDLTDLSKTLTTSSDDQDTSSFNSYMTRGTYNFSPEEGVFSFQTGFDFNYETARGKRIDSGFESIGDYALFTSAIWKPVESLSIQPGIRAAYNTRYNAPLTPSINLMYKPGKISIRASYARGFRSPSLKELYLYFFDSNHQVEGNDSLQAERSHSFIASANYKFTQGKTTLVFDVKPFFNVIDNKISLVQVDPDNLLHYRNENTGKFSSLGFEISGSLYQSSLLNLRAGYSRIGRKDDSFDSDNFIYSNNWNTSMDIDFLKNTAKFSVFYKYSGKYPTYYYNSAEEVTVGYINEFHNMDVSLLKKFWHSRFSVTTGVKNIFDNKEIGGQGGGTGSGHGSGEGTSSLVGWGRTFFLSLKINFVKY
ncbi:MAG TPA: TonB-dependent receptor [Draconibacterium sp.]|nr:TonB-dependent receptor [Draconibacterium sp.]